MHHARRGVRCSATGEHARSLVANELLSRALHEGRVAVSQDVERRLVQETRTSVAKIAMELHRGLALGFSALLLPREPPRTALRTRLDACRDCACLSGRSRPARR